MMQKAILAALAFTFFASIAQAGPADGQVARAKAAIEQGKFEAARTAAAAATKADPADYRAFYYLAMAEAGLDRIDNAKAAAAKALELAPAAQKSAVARLVDTLSPGEGRTASAKPGASAAADVFLRCAFTATWKWWNGSTETAEGARVFRIGAQSLHEWDEKTASWSGDHCVSDNKSNELSCSLTPNTFNWKARYGTERPAERASTINRLTGAYSEVYETTSVLGKSVKTSEGSCRTTPDPSAVKPKF